MSPTSHLLESLAAQHQRSPLDVLEFYQERVSIRMIDGNQSLAVAESGALEDVTQWLQSLKELRQ